MKQPQELMSMFVIPAIRNNIVKEFKVQGFKQEDIARLLDVTPSAISQYLKDKRGTEIEFCSEFDDRLKSDVNELVSGLGDDLKGNQNLVFKKINELSLYFRKERMLCPMCQKMNELVSGDCRGECR
jgi:predicted transcriptional regulator